MHHFTQVHGASAVRECRTVAHRYVNRQCWQEYRAIAWLNSPPSDQQSMTNGIFGLTIQCHLTARSPHASTSN
jgi:hypothetical protein